MTYQPFSREQSKLDAIQIKVRIAKTMAKTPNKSFKIKHPDWCRDAVKGDYTMLTKKVTEDCKKKQEQNKTFLEKLHAK